MKQPKLVLFRKHTHTHRCLEMDGTAKLHARKVQRNRERDRQMQTETDGVGAKAYGMKCARRCINSNVVRLSSDIVTWNSLKLYSISILVGFHGSTSPLAQLSMPSLMSLCHYRIEPAVIWLSLCFSVMCSQNIFFEKRNPWHLMLLLQVSDSRNRDHCWVGNVKRATSFYAHLHFTLHVTFDETNNSIFSSSLGLNPLTEKACILVHKRHLLLDLWKIFGTCAR